MTNPAIRLITSVQAVLPVAAVVLATSGPALIALGAVGCRLNLWDWRIGLIGAVALGLVLAVFAGTVSICALVACVVPPATGRGILLSALGLLAAAMTIGRIAMIASLAAGLPPINDVRTSELPDLFPDSSPENPVILSAGKWNRTTRAQAQAAAYPHVAPLRVSLPHEEATALAERIARRLGWRVDPIHIMPDGDTARFTARSVSRWYGFTDDIVVVVRAQGERSLIEIRSASRVGRSDLGANARRIKTFLDDILLASLRSR